MPRLRAIAITITALIVAASFFAVYLVLDDLTDQSQEDQKRYAAAREDRADLRSELQEQQSKTGLLAGQVESLGGKPVVTPSKPLPQSLRYVPVPGKTGPRGPVGRAGEDGADSTVPGPAGAAGSDGADSSVPGPQGATGAAGSTGERGPAGSDGKNGVSVTGATCSGGLTEQFTIVFTLSDDSTVSVSCGELPPVDPTPDPEPTD